MRLINTETLELHEHPKTENGGDVDYAILSHRWREEEVSFKQFRKTEKTDLRRLRGYIKILSACHFAKERGWDWIWMDTCCIDKRSSAELSEAINSMFQWYRDAAECIVLLDDIDTDSNMGEGEYSDRCSRSSRSDDHRCMADVLASCEWFSRGWTLQELIAPPFLVFCDGNWNVMGHLHKHTLKRGSGYVPHKEGRYPVLGESLLDDLATVTKIPRYYFYNNFAYANESIAARMSWASSRETTRIEDAAYCLMGLFGINMPLLYGEGQNAFRRLQEEIIRTSPDTSIFAWIGLGLSWHVGMLATHPEDFSACGETAAAALPAPGSFQLSNQGLLLETLSIKLPSVQRLQGRSDRFFLVDMGWGKIKIMEFGSRYVYSTSIHDKLRPEEQWSEAERTYLFLAVPRKRTFYIKL